MLPIFELASRIPPWVEPRLAFHVLFGLELLLFECGNFILIYRLSRKLEFGGLGDREIGEIESQPISQSLQSPNLPIILYALLFTPVYTLLGWFEAMPLFFLLLGLDLLLSNRRWSWIASAVAAALGFLTKLTPALLAPVAVRWLGARLRWQAVHGEWFNPKSPGNLWRPAVYVGVFLAVVTGVGYLLVDGKTALALSSLRVNSIRPPWQSLWAVLDGYYGYGLVPVDMRNLAGLERVHWESRLPWTWIGLAFGLVYVWLYTRRYDWTQVRTPVVFTAVSVIWLFLYSKGWSPQFLVWILAFVVLLAPTMTGVAIAVFLSFVNFIEANVFLVLLPGERWLLVGTVLVRTALLLLLMVEFLGQIWPGEGRARQLQATGKALAWGTMAVALFGALVAAPQAGRAYEARRLAEHPCHQAIQYWQAQRKWPDRLILTDQIETWQSLYPWLRQDYTIRIIDGYNTEDRPWEQVAAERLAALVDQEEFWWVRRIDLPVKVGAYLPWPEGERLEVHQFDRCTVQRILPVPDAPLATTQAAGGRPLGPVALLHASMDRPQVGADFHLVLYWQAGAAITESYTVFTQLIDSAGQVAAQQDNLPVQGLAPTNTWQANLVIRDPYRLAIPAELPPGAYRLIVGLYDASGRLMWTLPDGTTHDHLSFDVNVKKSGD
jgi:hypothetical protein